MMIVVMTMIEVIFGKSSSKQTNKKHSPLMKDQQVLESQTGEVISLIIMPVVNLDNSYCSTIANINLRKKYDKKDLFYMCMVNVFRKKLIWHAKLNIS